MSLGWPVPPGVWAFEMQDVGAALEYLKSGRHLGKIIIKV
jgi:hypothetical protein